jgi:F-type H+-transporting ATPase subunit b
MPHLNFETFFGQIFWLVVSFAVLYALVSALILPKIASVVELRGKTIADNLDAAEQLKNEAEESEKAHHKALAESAEKARGIITEAYEKAKVKSASKHQELAQRLENKTREAEEEILGIKNSANKVAAEVSEQISGLITNKILKAA